MEEERKSVKASGRTIEEAIESALTELGAQREEVEIQILAQGGRRLLGLGSQEARVKVTLRPKVPESEAAKAAREILEQLLKGLAVEGRVSLQSPEVSLQEAVSPIVLDIDGPDLGILIGRRGETLRALQYVTRLIASHRLHQWADIIVDVGGYKRRREITLTELARRMAQRALDEAQAVALEPMPPHERRIIHLALKDYPGISTHSVGEGEQRKVIITPQSEGS
jgi:spoIIIJ-associated protein